MFCTKGVLRNFAKFTGKHLCQSFFFNKVADLRPATLLKKRLWHRCFSCGFCKIFKNLFTEHLQWLLLTISLCLCLCLFSFSLSLSLSYMQGKSRTFSDSISSYVILKDTLISSSKTFSLVEFLSTDRLKSQPQIRDILQEVSSLGV